VVIKGEKRLDLSGPTVGGGGWRGKRKEEGNGPLNTPDFNHMPTTKDDFLRVYAKLREELLQDVADSNLTPDAVSMTREFSAGVL
jgi:hypothetical protein